MTPRDEERSRWLDSVLAGRAARVEAASADASFRRYFRVHVDGTSQILMDAPPPEEDCRPFVEITGLLAAAGINVPSIRAMELERGFLLLSDLGDRIYLDALDEGSAEQLYGDAIDALVRLQHHGDADRVPDYDAAKLHTEMQLFADWFLERHLGVTLDDRTRTVLADSFALLAAECLAQPQVLVHRDYHSRNLMLVEHDNPGVLDYQDAVRGPITYDLVSLLRDVYIRWPDADVYRWVSQWHDRARAAGLTDAVERDSVFRWFDLTGVQRHLKVAGIFARLWYRDGKPRYLDDLPLTLDYLLAASARYPELRALHTLLRDLAVQERSHAASAALVTRPPPR